MALFGPSDLLALEQSDPDHWRVQLVSLGLLDGRPTERPRLARLASPALHADGGCAPFLIFHGRDDELVPVEQSERLHAALKGAGVSSTLVTYEHLSHSDAALGNPDLRRRLHAFLDDTLRPRPDVSREHRRDAGGAGTGVDGRFCRSPFAGSARFTERVWSRGSAFVCGEVGDLDRVVGAARGYLDHGDVEPGGEESPQLGSRMRTAPSRFDHQ